VLRKVRKLRQLAADLRRGHSFQVTRLTVLKSLCGEPALANRFALYLARKTLEHVERGLRRSGRLPAEQDRAHRQLMAEAVRALEDWPESPPEPRRRELWDLLGRMQAEQNEHRPIPFGTLRLIRDWDLLIVEGAVRCVLRPREAGHWVYQLARDYAERSDPHHPGGLVPASAPLVQDIADFWADVEETSPLGEEDRGDPEAKAERKQAVRRRVRKGSAAPRPRKTGRSQPGFTERQGQFLAFIHLYCKLHRQGPAELDMVQFFRVTPPSVHGMVIKLEELGLVTRQPGVARSVRVAIPEDEIPELEDVAGPPW
jgi:hypothetical protein